MNHFEELDALLDQRNLSRIEMPTPHKVSVLILTNEYLKCRKGTTDAGLVFPVQARRNFAMLLLKLIQYPDMTYNDLHAMLCSQRYQIERLHLENFESTMNDLCSLGIEQLFQVADMQTIEQMISEAWGVSQFSIAGLYIRRVGIILERLSFPEMMSMYKNICMYYEKGIRAMALGPTATSQMCSSSTSTGSATGSKQQQQQQQKNASSEFDCSLDFSLTLSLEDMEPALPSEHVPPTRNVHSKWSPRQADLFVSQQSILLEYNERRALPPIEMQNRLQEILQDNPLKSHAYFLNYMNQLRLRDYFGAMQELHRSSDRCPANMIGNYEPKGFQSFSLNLAVLHAAFGHRQEALTSLRECIMLAQESGDKRCLDLANSWHCLLNSERINPFAKNLPELQDPGLIQSLTLAIQFVVKHGVHSGYLPLDLFELLRKSDELNMKNSMLEYVSDSMSLRAGLWSLYGRHEMSALYSQLLLNMRKTWGLDDIGNPESVCKVLSSLALWLSVQGEYQKSLVVLNHARERFPRYPYANNWMISKCLIAAQKALYHCQWTDALNACSQLYLLDKSESILMRATVCIARRYADTARCLLEKLQAMPDLELRIQVRALLLQAYTTMSTKDITGATVDLLIRASVMARSAFMFYEHAIIDMAMAEALLQLGLKQKALQTLTNCMEQIYVNGGCYDRAKFDFLFGRCTLAVANDDDIASKRQRFRLAKPVIERSVEEFKKLQAHAKVLNVYRFLALLYDELQETDMRNIYATHFVRYHEEYPIALEYMDSIY